MNGSDDKKKNLQCGYEFYKSNYVSENPTTNSQEIVITSLVAHRTFFISQAKLHPSSFSVDSVSEVYPKLLEQIHQ